jgi:hypothetical protein
MAMRVNFRAIIEDRHTLFKFLLLTSSVFHLFDNPRSKKYEKCMPVTSLIVCNNKAALTEVSSCLYSLMLKCVYLAPDEFTAITLKEMLASRDIKAMTRRFETSWLDGLPKVMKGGWGEVLVDEKDEAQAEECIKEFLEQSTEIEPDSEPDDTPEE